MSPFRANRLPTASLIISRPFHMPEVFSTQKPLYGASLPIVTREPLISQLPARSSSVLVRDVQQIPIDKEGAETIRTFVRALDRVSEDSDAAGELFKEVRIARQKVQDMLVDGATDELFVGAVFGEALYGRVDIDTFSALRQIRKAADEVRGDSSATCEEREQAEILIAREMLHRSAAHSRVGDDESSFHVLEHYHSCDVVMKSVDFRINGILMYTGLLENRAARHRGKVRSEALDYLVKAMLTDLRVVIEEVQKTGAMQSGLIGAMPNHYISIAEYLLRELRPKDALDVAHAARVLFPKNKAIEDLFNGDCRTGSDTLLSTNVSALKKLIIENKNSRQNLTLVDHVAAGMTAFVQSMQFESNKVYWKHAMGGCLSGAVCGAFNGTLGSTMLGSGIGAAVLVGAGKIWRGFKAEETRQALITGYSRGSLGKAVFAETLKLLGTYALFGGVLPIAPFVPDIFLATKGDIAGQLHGLGSALSYAVHSGVQRAGEMVNAIAVHGLNGPAEFWQNWVDTSYFARSIDAALRLPFNDPFGQIFQKTSWERIPAFLRTFPMGSPAEIVQSITLGAMYAYMGISGTYALLGMHPTLRDKMKKYLPSWFNDATFPGAYLATVAGMIASGMKPDHAAVFTFICYLVQHRQHVQSGGEINIFKGGVWTGLDLTKYMRAGAVQLLYLGPGDAIKPFIPKPTDWLNFNDVASYVLNNVEAHFGMVPFLALLGVAHAYVTGLNVKQTLKAKYAKAYTYEIPANTLKLMLGWTSLWGNVAATAIKEFGFGAIVTQSFREAGDSRLQRDAFMSYLKKIAMDMQLNGSAEGIGDAAGDHWMDVELYREMKANADAIRKGAVAKARQGQAFEHLNESFIRRSLPEQLLTLADVYFMKRDYRVLLGPHIDERWYRTIIYRALVDPATPRETVEEFLRRLTLIAGDVNPELHYARYNLLLATMRAADGAAHGTLIKQYFDEGPGKTFMTLNASHIDRMLDEFMALNGEEKDPKKIEMKKRAARRDLVKVYGHLGDRWAEVKKLRKERDRDAWISLPFGRLRRFFKKHLVYPEGRAGIKFYAASATGGRVYPYSALFSGRSFVENAAALTSFLLTATQKNPPFQTFADTTLYRGTIYRFLMTPAKKADLSEEAYRDEILDPLLHGIGTAADHLGDGYKDARHNLLVSVWLASQGPHGEVIREWIDKDVNRARLQANGIYGNPKIPGRQIEEGEKGLPKGLNESRLIDDLFDDYLWDSDNSTDGQVVYPTSHWKPIEWSSCRRGGVQ